MGQTKDWCAEPSNSGSTIERGDDRGGCLPKEGPQWGGLPGKPRSWGGLLGGEKTPRRKLRSQKRRPCRAWHCSSSSSWKLSALGTLAIMAGWCKWPEELPGPAWRMMSSLRCWKRLGPKMMSSYGCWVGCETRSCLCNICTDGCAGTLTDPLLVHGRSFEEVNLNRLPWLTNLEEARPAQEEPGVDELAKLRELHAKARGDDRRAEKKPSKKEKKRKRAEEKKVEEGRVDGPPKAPQGGLEVGQKALEDVFGSTGLDPNPDCRKKVLKKAKRLGKGKKKRKKKSSSSSEVTSSSSTSTSSSSGGDDDSGLFGENTKLHRIWKKCLGALTAAAIREARQGLMSQTGTLWNINQSELPPIFTQFFRQQVIQPHGVSPALVQEILTLSQVLDYLLQGKIAGSADMVCQRLKSLEGPGQRDPIGRQGDNSNWCAVIPTPSPRATKP